MAKVLVECTMPTTLMVSLPRRDLWQTANFAREQGPSLSPCARCALTARLETRIVTNGCFFDPVR